MPLIDTSSTNDAIRRLVEYKFRERLGEKSLERQLEYLRQSNALYGERQKERIRETGEKQKEVYQYKHGLDMEKLAEQNAHWLAKQPRFQQIMYMFSREQNPDTRKKLGDMISTYAEVLGGTIEDSIKGKSPGEDRLAFLTQFTDPGTLGTYINTMSANYRGAVSSGIQKRRTDIQQKKLEQKPTEKEKHSLNLNKQVAEKAKQVLSYIDKSGDKIMLGAGDNEKGAESQAGKIKSFVSRIQTLAMQGKVADDPMFQDYLDFLDLVYESPKSALDKMKYIKDYRPGSEKDVALTKQTREGLDRARIDRALKSLPQGTRTAVNPQTGEIAVFINGKWTILK